MSNDPYGDVRTVYDALKKEMAGRFPPEHYVAIAGGKMVADAVSNEELRQKVRALGLNEAKVMFDKVGFDMLEFDGWPGWILMNAAVEYWVECLLSAQSKE